MWKHDENTGWSNIPMNQLIRPMYIITEIGESKVLITYKRKEDKATLESDIKTVDKAAKLLNLFSDVKTDDIKTMLASDAGKLAFCVIQNQCDTQLVRMLIDELKELYLTIESERRYVTRQSLINELEDVLKAKSITPYRRSRINKALKRDCLRCYGGGKVPRITEQERGILGQRKQKHEIDIRSPDCPHCYGSGIEPKLDKIKPEDSHFC